MKLTDFQQSMMCTAMFVALLCGGMYLVDGSSAQYVVTEKGKDRIAYRDLDGRDTHVMVFDADTAGIGFDVYSHVNVGDTITGHARTMRKPVASTWYNRDGNIKTSSVAKINGIDIRNLRLKNRYDEWLCQMKQKQR